MKGNFYVLYNYMQLIKGKGKIITQRLRFVPGSDSRQGLKPKIIRLNHDTL